MAISRLSTADPQEEKVVTREDLELIIKELEDVSYRKACQCTPLAFFNLLPDIQEKEQEFRTLEEYYQSFLGYEGQKPYIWYINRTMRKINNLSQKKTIQIRSTRNVVMNENGEVVQRARLHLFNELGYFRINSNINVNTGRGINEVSFLAVPTELYLELKQKYAGNKNVAQSVALASEVDDLLYTHKTKKYHGNEVETVRSNFIIDPGMTFDECYFTQIKEAINNVGGLSNVVFMDFEWLQRCPGQEMTGRNLQEEVNTCYQVGYYLEQGVSQVKNFYPIKLPKLDVNVEANEEYLITMGLDKERFEGIATCGDMALDGLHQVLTEVFDKTSLIMVSSKEDEILIRDFFEIYCTDDELKNRYQNTDVLVSQSLFLGYFTPRIQTLARLCGLAEATHTFNAGDDAKYLCSILSDMIKHDTVQGFFGTKDEYVQAAISKYREGLPEIEEEDITEIESQFLDFNMIPIGINTDISKGYKKSEESVESMEKDADNHTQEEDLDDL